MASVQQGEKQLFDKFWMGTFKAVATPRRESSIAASITARRPAASNEVKSSPSTDQNTQPKKPNGDVENGNGTERLGRALTPYQHDSDGFSETEKVRPSPPPKGKKKKKKKSERKKRKRSQSYNPSTVKKKKKKSSKKRKRNRSSSKKRRQSSSSPKSKRKQVRKHRKHSRGRSRKSHHHHHRHSRSISSQSRSSFENRVRERSREIKHQAKKKKHKYHNSRSVNKKAKEATPLSAHNSLYTTKMTISQSIPSLLVTPESNRGCRKEATNDYDSGNEMCSPPSTQSSSSVLKLSQEKQSPAHQGFGHDPSSAKTPNGHSDNISDSGNSSASFFSFTKESSLPLGDPQTQAKRDRSSCLGCLEEHKCVSDLSSDRKSLCGRRSRSSSYSNTRRSYSRDSSHSISSYSSYYRSSSGRKSRSRSSSVGARSYSRSSSYSSKSGRKSNRSRSSHSRRSPSYSNYSPSRDCGKSKYNSEENGTRKRPHRIRRSSYSPMKKRRRDSPSHLEARRITSARKRPIPYYRPSPSSSSSSSSTPSWYKPRSRSRSRSYFSDRSSRSRSHSSSRSRSRDSNRSRSRSRSWSQSSDSCASTRR